MYTKSTAITLQSTDGATSMPPDDGNRPIYEGLFISHACAPHPPHVLIAVGGMGMPDIVASINAVSDASKFPSVLVA